MSLHSDAVAELSAWSPPSPQQAALRDRYLDHLAAHPDGLDRGCRPNHLTASTLVLSHDRTQVLLTLHGKARRWFQFGGHPEAVDATLAGAALREAVEESGLVGLELEPGPVHLDEHEVPFCGAPTSGDPDGRGHGVVHHLDVRYVAVAPVGASPVVSDESIDVRWWPVDALPEADLAPLVEAAQSRSSSGAPAGPAGPGSNSDGGDTRAASDQPSR